MRHQNAGRKFSRHSQERSALYKNLIIALFKHGRIHTTEPKAKEIRRHAEHLITLAKRSVAKAADTKNPAVVLAARRRARIWVHEPEVLQNLLGEIAQRFASRPGGYTRIIKTVERLGDNAPMAFIELMPGEAAPAAPAAAEEPKKKTKKAKAEAAPEAASAAEAKPKRSRKKKVDEE